MIKQKPYTGRFIDADKVGLTDFEILVCNGDYKEALKMILDKIENAQTVEIVLCKDCKYYKTTACISFSSSLIGENDYCSKAERRTKKGSD